MVAGAQAWDAVGPGCRADRPVPGAGGRAPGRRPARGRDRGRPWLQRPVAVRHPLVAGCVAAADEVAFKLAPAPTPTAAETHGELPGSRCQAYPGAPAGCRQALAQGPPRLCPRGSGTQVVGSQLPEAGARSAAAAPCDRTTSWRDPARTGRRRRRSSGESSQPLMTPCHRISAGGSGRYTVIRPGQGHRAGRPRHGSALVPVVSGSSAVAARTLSPCCSVVRRAGPGVLGRRSSWRRGDVPALRPDCGSVRLDRDPPS